MNESPKNVNDQKPAQAGIGTNANHHEGWFDIYLTAQDGTVRTARLDQAGAEALRRGLDDFLSHLQ